MSAIKDWAISLGNKEDFEAIQNHICTVDAGVLAALIAGAANAAKQAGKGFARDAMNEAVELGRQALIRLTLAK